MFYFKVLYISLELINLLYFGLDLNHESLTLWLTIIPLSRNISNSARIVLLKYHLGLHSTFAVPHAGNRNRLYSCARGRPVFSICDSCAVILYFIRLQFCHESQHLVDPWGNEPPPPPPNCFSTLYSSEFMLSSTSSELKCLFTLDYSP